MYKLFSRYREGGGPDFSINPLTLAFQDTGIERSFKASYFESNLQLGRACHLLAAFFYCLVGLWDGLFFDPAHLPAWQGILIFVCLVFAAGLVSSFFIPSFYARFWQQIFTFYVLVTGGDPFVLSDEKKKKNKRFVTRSKPRKNC